MMKNKITKKNYKNKMIKKHFNYQKKDLNILKNYQKEVKSMNKIFKTNKKKV